MSPTHTLYRFSVDDYEQMIESGILDENSRVEFIRGRVVQKMPVGDRHAACVKRFNRLMNQRVGDRAVIGVQDPVRFDDSVPEPDLSLLRPREDFYESVAPRPADVFLLVEVSDTTIDYDRDVKGPLYAEAGVPEYWIVNLNDDTLEVQRQPRTDGTYADVKTLSRGQQVEVAALPGIVVSVDEMF
jgi:Uma2 family endonuclease